MEEGFSDNVGQQGPAKALRLIFEYEGDKVKLISQTPVEMALTSNDIAHAEHTSYFVDTRDEADNTLARVSAHGAFQTSTEVFPEQHGAPITRVEITKPKGAFTVIAPATDDAHHVTVVRAVAPATPKTGAAHGIAPEAAVAKQTTDIASFTINKNPKQ